MVGHDQGMVVCAALPPVASCGELRYNQFVNDDTEKLRRRHEENDLSHDPNLYL